MNTLPDEMMGRVSALRRSFDETFAVASRPRQSADQTLLAIQVGGMKLAVRLEELAGIHPCRKIVPLPNRAEGLLGIAGFRGRLLAVYDLAALLGCHGSDQTLRWMLLASVDPHMALAIDALEAHIQVAEAALYQPCEEDSRSGRIRELVEVSGVARGVLSIPAIVHAARERTQVFHH